MNPRRLMVPARHELPEVLRPLRKQLRYVVEALGLPFDDSFFTSPHLQASSSEDVDSTKVLNTLLRKVADKIVQRSQPLVFQQPSLRQKGVKSSAEASIPLPASKETSMQPKKTKRSRKRRRRRKSRSGQEQRQPASVPSSPHLNSSSPEHAQQPLAEQMPEPSEDYSDESSSSSGVETPLSQLLSIQPVAENIPAVAVSIAQEPPWNPYRAVDQVVQRVQERISDPGLQSVTIDCLETYGQAVQAEYPIAPNMPSYVPSEWSSVSAVFQWFAEAKENISDNICYNAYKVYECLSGGAEYGDLSRAEVSQMFSSLVDGDLFPRKAAWSRVVGPFA